jgi:hypothetical protein
VSRSCRILMALLALIAFAMAVAPQGTRDRQPRPNPVFATDHQPDPPVTITVVRVWVEPDDAIMARVRFQNRTSNQVLIPFPHWDTCGNGRNSPSLVFTTWVEGFQKRVAFPSSFKNPLPVYRDVPDNLAIVISPYDATVVTAELGTSRELRGRKRLEYCRYINSKPRAAGDAPPDLKPYIGTDGILYGQIEVAYDGP